MSNNFAEAKTYLETALNYTSNENFIDDTLFYLAKIAENDQDIVKAKDLYNQCGTIRRMLIASINTAKENK